MKRPNFGNAYDREDASEVIQTDRPSPRPRDAATLILVRRDQSEPRVLMGKRSSRHDFMPDKYVFPGGRVDPQDSRAASYNELTRREEARLRFQTRRLPRAFAMTAVRETFEETGLLLGRDTDLPAKPPPGWERLYEFGIAPELARLRFIGRAITPPYRPKRFDARFFMAEAEKVLMDDRPPLDGAELHDLQWVSIKDSLDLDLPNVTRFMLAEIDERLKTKDDPGPPFVRWTRGGSKTDRI